ncbi:MAG: DUF4402 domain-containing protein [Bacteroidota bacterium]|nr:DUF4402 domain-containing protein [Bacteroidota bacterium]
MRAKTNITSLCKRFIIMASVIAFSSAAIYAQPPHPPRPVRIDPTAQGLAFGAFYGGAAGGTVVITPSSTRSATGDVILFGLGFVYTAALFEVHAHPGTVISILNGPDAILTGSPSGSMTLHIGDSNPASPFVRTLQFNVPQPLYIGGTLTVGNPAANPPGSYTGTFDITLVQE